MSRLLLLLLALSSSLPAFSATTAEFQSARCSDSLSFVADGPLSFNCTGNFSLSGGVLSSDSRIVLSSTGLLSLENLSISAPLISLIGADVMIGSEVLLSASSPLSISASGGGGWRSPLIASSATLVNGADITAISRIDATISLDRPTTLANGGHIAVAISPGISLYSGATINASRGNISQIGGTLMVSRNIELVGTGGPLVIDGSLSVLAMVPEPESYAMLIAGLGLIGAAARRRKTC